MKIFCKGHVFPWAASYHQMLMAMKLTAFLLTAALLTAHAGGFSQNVTLDVDNAPLKKVFTEIRKQTGYSVFYNYDLLKKGHGVTMHVQNMPLQSALLQCMTGQPLSYFIQNKTIFISDK